MSGLNQRELPLLNGQAWAEGSQPDGALVRVWRGEGVLVLEDDLAGLSLHHENGKSI